MWAGVSISMNLWWLAYGLSSGLWGIVPVSGAAAILYCVIVVSYVRTRGRSSLAPLALGGFVLGMVPLPFLLVAGWDVAGVAIGFCYGMQLVPAVVVACRTRDLDGVAPGTWIMAWIESTIWLVYGLSASDGALLAGGASGTLMASIIIGRLVVTGHRPFGFSRPMWATN